MLYLYDKVTYYIYGVIAGDKALTPDYTLWDAIADIARVEQTTKGETYYVNADDVEFFYEDVAYIYGEPGMTSDDIRREVEEFWRVMA